MSTIICYPVLLPIHLLIILFPTIKNPVSKVRGFSLQGAGKTTTFGMLTGEFPISAGTAYLDGYNIQTQLRQVIT
jgi:ABC-type uncharacterized transport system ATPase subunit